MNLTEWTPMLRKRLYEYRKQDRENGTHDKPTAITAAETLALVAKAKGKCKYCRQPVSFERNLAMDGAGFTLGRKVNSVGHTLSNVVISCLACNLKKR
jgi:hypothetical protein